MVAETAPMVMEDRFVPGLKTRPGVHVGSQTMRFFHGDPKEQAWEALHLAAAFDRDVVVVRDIDPGYLAYWHDLIGEPRVLNLSGAAPGEFLTRAILDSEPTIESIKRSMAPGAALMVFFATPLEQDLADTLGIPLHGSPAIGAAFGTKSGIRALAAEDDLPMSPGFVCSTDDEVCEAVRSLGERFDAVAIKHDLSTGGGWSTKWETRSGDDLGRKLDEIAGGRFVDGRDTVVVEGWLASTAALSAHIEIVGGREPVICAAWEQIIDADGTSYIGAKPLTLSDRAKDSLWTEVNRVAAALHRRGAVGSFGPDFLVVGDDETGAEPNTVVLLELNARVPATAFPLEIVKRVKGKVGAGFCARHVKLSRPASFAEIGDALRDDGLLIDERDDRARGVVPYNIGLLPWNLFDVVVMADCWEETLRLTARVDDLLGNVLGHVGR